MLRRALSETRPDLFRDSASLMTDIVFKLTARRGKGEQGIKFCFLSPCDRRWDVTCGDDVWFKCWGPDLLTMWDFICAFSANFCHFFTGGSRGDPYYYWESSESSRTLQRPLYHIWSNEVSEAGFGINVAVWISMSLIFFRTVNLIERKSTTFNHREFGQRFRWEKMLSCCASVMVVVCLKVVLHWTKSSLTHHFSSSMMRALSKNLRT